MEGAPAYELTNERGVLRGWFPSRTRLTTQMVGAFTPEHARAWMKLLDDFIAEDHGPIVCFHDWERATDYDIQARTHAVAWTVSHRRRFGEIHMLVDSAPIYLGARVAALVIGSSFVVHRRRGPFVDAARGQGISVPPGPMGA